MRNHGATVSCDAAVRDPLLFMFLIACCATAVILVRLLKSRGGQPHVGIQLSYLAAFWVNHWFAVSAYLIPGYCGIYPEFEVPGTRVSLYGLLGLTVGLFLLPKVFGARPFKDTGFTNSAPVSASLRYGLLFVGILFYIAAHVVKVKGLQAIIVGGQQVTTVAVVLNIWEAVRRRQKQQVAFWVVLSLLFPFATVVQNGFLGYGISSLAPVFVFATACIGRRNFARVGVFGLVGLYLGLSLYVNYMRDRTQIRASVWGGDRFSARVERFAQTFQHFEWFSPVNPDHLDRVVARMNQTWLVGAGVVYVENTQQWARGSTLKDAMLAFIPRLIWRNKPEAGSSELTTRSTGIEFAGGTSVGIGQVLELYVNYGSFLVFFGFLVYGGVLAYLDRTARKGLASGAFNRFSVCFIAGLAMQQMIEPVAVIGVSCIAGLIVIYGLQMFMRLKSRPRPRPVLQQPGILRPYAENRLGL